MSSIGNYPALLLNADFRPLETYPLSLLDAKDAIKMIYEDNAVVVAEYDKVIRSPSITMKLPSVIALKRYAKVPRIAPFNRFNVFLRDGFTCQYCGKKGNVGDLTYDHVVPRCDGGKTDWENIAAACQECNTKKDRGYDMKPIRQPFEPSSDFLEKMKRRFPPSYLHESWIDFLYWDTPLENDIPSRS